MEHTWRWFGVNDSITLQDIRQAGATGIVTALHDIPNGEVWPVSAIQTVKDKIEAAGLRWSVVESIPVHEDIKQRTGEYQKYIENYGKSIQNLAACGIQTVCYNFMPVLDWTRTDLTYALPDGSRALRFDQTAFAAFDLFILQRPNSEKNYSEAEIAAAQAYFSALSDEQKELLISTILAGLPGAEESYSLDNFRAALAAYDDIDKDILRENFAYFLEHIVPIAESCGVSLAVHPDDPPRPILGLPRIVSTKQDVEWLVERIPSSANGITFCTGSYGVREDNDLCDMATTFADRIYFTHLRSTQREETWGSFHEAAHLEGNADISDVILVLLKEEQRRQQAGIDKGIPLRPDHGHQIMDDLRRDAKPGYSALGRMKGLAEIRGVEFALKKYVLKDE
ncbi:mannonate dehydratase [Marinomonas rhizomae]|uniref:Mannonate dehydratase n=1 Tax=Marinomonas rhizomae TaxID=491948 RepID=A0A366JFN4_9GAMM|nr:mannonate dehydratase [Marinomonas rhizomae]RBP85115.1 D-mannonate dehydratase [Marinomonas rhizomae]RNF76224.1 mannonate dehydratase [Marinomonas rhizomae]